MELPMGVLPSDVFADAGTALASALVALVGALFAGLFSGIMARRNRRNAEHDLAELNATPLEAKLARVVSLSRQLNALNSEVQAEFALQIAATEKAKLEAQQAEAIAALNKEQQDAAAAMVKAQIDASLASSSQKDRKFQIWVAVGSFFGGVAATIVTTLIFSALGVGA